MNEIKFLSVDDVEELHALGIAQHGGDGTLRDRGLLESSVAQAMNVYHYGSGCF